MAADQGLLAIIVLVLSGDSKRFSQAVRDKADQVILSRDAFPASLFNPYVVRARSKRSREQPYIFIAVAEGVQNT